LTFSPAVGRGFGWFGYERSLRCLEVERWGFALGKSWGSSWGYSQVMGGFENHIDHVSLGLLCDNRTQGWGTKKYISDEIREQGVRWRNRKKKDICFLRQV
jgi:hypothetical protein